MYGVAYLQRRSGGANGSITGMLACHSAFHFVLVLGVGAKYPYNSVAASEQPEEPSVAKNTQHRWFALATKSMVDFGFVVSAFVRLVLLWILFYMPGTLAGAFIVDYLGPKYTMITGLLLQALFGFVMSGCYGTLSKHIGRFAVMYGIFLSFGELGPGNCLGLLASKTCPSAVRGQYYGLAAAIGKVGVFVGTWAFPPIIDAFGKLGPDQKNTGPFWIGSGLAILSAATTYFFITPLTHEGMLEEDRKFREYLVEHGYDIINLGLHDTESTVTSEPEADHEKKSEGDVTDVKVHPA